MERGWFAVFAGIILVLAASFYLPVRGVLALMGVALTLVIAALSEELREGERRARWRPRHPVRAVYDFSFHFFMPLIHFQWTRDLGREDLSAEEVAALNALLRRAVLDPRAPQTLSCGRLGLHFQYRETLPLPLPGPAPDLVTPLIAKIRTKVDQAWDRQLCAARTINRPTACYVLVNVDDDTNFYQGERYRTALDALTSEWQQWGLRLVTDPDARYI